MNAQHDQNRLKELLQQAMPPVNADAAPERDLWPAMQRRLEAQPAAKSDAPVLSGWTSKWAWFDGALAVSLLGLVVLFPAAIPILLYYL